MKILILSHHFFPTIGGIESYSLGLAKELKAKGIDASVACLDREPNSRKKLPKAETIQGSMVKRVPFIDLGFYKIAFGLLEEIKKVDLVHVQNIGFLSDFALLSKPLHKKPVVISTHGGIFHTKKRVLLKALYWNWLGFALKNADAVIADSKQDFEEFSGKAEKIVLAENGVELKKFFSLKRKTILSSFVFVGRISENKQLGTMLECFALLAKQKKFSLRIIGKDFDCLVPALKQKAIALGIAEMVSFEENVSETGLLGAFAESEFFVSASGYEGFGISTIEAMAAGCIPILNAIPTFKSFVDNGENGFIAEFNDARKAAGKILAAMELSAREKNLLSESARKSVQKFEWKNAIKKIVIIYNGVLDENRAR